MPALQVDSPDLVDIDFSVNADLVDGNFVVDLSPISYEEGGRVRVLGANIKIENPYSVIVKQYPQSGYDVNLPDVELSTQKVIPIPTEFEGFQNGIYRITVDVVDSQHTHFDLVKDVTISPVNTVKRVLPYGIIAATMVGSCQKGLLYVNVDRPPIYNGAIPTGISGSYKIEFPQNSVGDQLAPYTSSINSFTVSLFDGVYVLTGTTIATYDLGDMILAKVMFKTVLAKEIFCSVDWCCLYKQILNIYSDLATCSDKYREYNSQKAIKALLLMSAINMSIDCGEDPSESIDTLQRLLGCSLLSCGSGLTEITPREENSTGDALTQQEYLHFKEMEATFYNI